MGTLPITAQTGNISIMKWVGENGKSALEDVYGGQRNEGPHFANFMDVKVFWPPPTEPWTVNTASCCWEAAIPDDNFKAVNLESFCTLVKASTAQMTRRCVLFITAY
jgi:hypothetical protein